MFITATSELLPRGSEAQDGGVWHKAFKPSTIQSGGSLMSVVPSIIVLVITALVVFHRERDRGREVAERHVNFYAR